MALALAPLLASLGLALQLTSADRMPRRAEAGERDSIRALRAARRAQDDFERIRRWSAPRSFDRSPAPCADQVIGRICHWYGDTAETQPPDEPGRIVAARRELLARLSSSASVAGGDDWIAGQRTRYLAEAGDTAGAVALGRDCRATAWWCDALLGFALHAARRYAESDSAFGSALARMPERERCEWENLSALLADGSRRGYDRKSCAARHVENERIWWLADPFLAVPGNDRRTEHFARLTMSRMQEQAWNAHALTWGEDLEEVTVRYGWSTWFTRGQPPMHAAGRVPITGMSRTPAYHFLPDEDVLSDPRAAADGWSIAPLVHGGTSAREYYAPAYAITVTELETDAQLFKRGDSMLVVATYDATHEPKLEGLTMDAALALSSAPGDEPIIAWQRHASRRGVLTALAPWHSMMASVELLSTSGARAGRARRWVGIDSGSIATGLLLLDPKAGSPRTLEEALPHLLTRAELVEGSRLALYWETTGGSRGDTLMVTLSVGRERPGGLRRFAQSLGLARKWTPIRMAWSEPVLDDGSVAGRSLVLDLSELERGSYRLELRVTRVGGETITAEREIQIIR